MFRFFEFTFFFKTGIQIYTPVYSSALTHGNTFLQFVETKSRIKLVPQVSTFNPEDIGAFKPFTYLEKSTFLRLTYFLCVYLEQAWFTHATIKRRRSLSLSLLFFFHQHLVGQLTDASSLNREKHSQHANLYSAPVVGSSNSSGSRRRIISPD